MKFTLATISAALLAVSTVSGAAILDKRQDNNQDANQDPNQNPNQDPNQQQNAQLDIGTLNGTWYLTGATQNILDVYSIIQKTMNIDVNCLQVNVTQASESSFDAFISTFLTRNGSEVGVNASAASTAMLQTSDSSVNASDHEYAWTGFASQVFVNQAQWKNFSSNGQSTDSTDDGSVAIPGTKPVEANIYTKLIDSNAEPGSGSADNIDTIFIWGTEAKFHDVHNNKRADEIYGAILSKTSSVAEDVFNKTLEFLPSQVAANNASIVLLPDTCHTEDADQNGDQNNDQNNDQQNGQNNDQNNEQPAQ